LKIRTNKGIARVKDTDFVKVKCKIDKNINSVISLIGYVKAVTTVVSNVYPRSKTLVFHQVGYITDRGFHETPESKFENRTIDEQCIDSITFVKNIFDSGETTFSYDGNKYIV
jgi:hypothetical protein